jgi:spore coat polysaccharide biosynthesis protein SpsF
MRVVAIIQARMGSTRLPGKVMQDLAGEPMLSRVVQRAGRAMKLQDIVVATTINSADDAIAQLCQSRGWVFFRGSEDDVLDRYYRTAVSCRAEAVVRITSDCPLIEPEVIDRVVQAFLSRLPQLDYASNGVPRRTFPRGLDTEVMRFDALERAWNEDQNPAWREHVTPYIYCHPELFPSYCVANGIDYSSMRWTVDTSEDLAFTRCIYEHFGHDRFSWREVLAVLEEHREWLEINQHVRQKAIPGNTNAH